ncbi:MAG TPA: hypothetical protein VH062_30620 [Polyangiaceae bacterium]|nr:hypothetical protein [Polyangiaceae bacterium]
MRTTRRAFALIFALTAGCGGQTLSEPSDFDGGTTTARSQDGSANTVSGQNVGADSAAPALCDDVGNAYLASSCGAGPEAANYVSGECRSRFATTPAACADALITMYTSDIEYSKTCDGPSLDASSKAETDYALCLSGGKCTIPETAVEDMPIPSHPASTYMHTKLCECTDQTWETSSAECTDFHACGTVCCTCPGGNFAYTAAACDLSSGTGVCPPAERVCELTQSFCVHSL